MTAFDWVVSTASHVQRLTREMQMTSTSKLYKVQHLACTVVGVPGGVRHEIWPISQLYSNNRSWLGYRISSNNCRPSPPLWYEIKNNRLSPPGPTIIRGNTVCEHGVGLTEKQLDNQRRAEDRYTAFHSIGSKGSSKSAVK